MPTAPAPAAAAETLRRLVLFDGDCAVCARSVRWLLDADREGRFHFAPLHGPTAAAVRARHPELPPTRDSIVYVERTDAGERVFMRADAIFRLLEQIDTPAARRYLRLRALPGWLTDLGYRLFAASRLRLGRWLPTCRLPTSGERARFLP